MDDDRSDATADVTSGWDFALLRYVTPCQLFFDFYFGFITRCAFVGVPFYWTLRGWWFLDSLEFFTMCMRDPRVDDLSPLCLIKGVPGCFSMFGPFFFGEEVVDFASILWAFFFSLFLFFFFLINGL